MSTSNEFAPFAPVSPLGRADLSRLRPLNVDRFWYGACYYPEHWDAETRRLDAERMEAAGFNAVRMAEFAWDRMEPEEGRFDFSLFEETIETLGARGIHTIFCTPTATPPRWLTMKHPEILRIDAHGVPMCHGSRQHCDYNHPVFREHSRRITRAMAERFRANPFVIGWQTDNEIYCHFSEDHSPAAEAAFQAYLRERYDGDINGLNRAWGTAFWAQTYRSFDEIPTPRDKRPTFLNPGHHLDYFRFLSEAAARFQHEQVAILREVNPKWFVFHNGVFRKPDYRGLFSKDLDFVGYDVYPNFQPEAANRAASQAFNSDRVRAMVGNVIIPEHQSGPGGQNTYTLVSPEPGELRLLSYRSIARGADSLLFFRWRTCRFGAEQYWRGILEHDNVPRRRYVEVALLGRELQALGPLLIGTSVRMDCAVAAGDYDVRWSHETYPMGLPHSDEPAEKIHRWLYDRGYNVGCAHPEDVLEGLKLLVVPHWALFRERWVESLAAWVRQGGVLIVGARTGTRNKDNQIVAETPPGPLAELCGVRVTDFGRLREEAQRPMALSSERGEATAEFWWEELEAADDVETAARWTSRFLADTPAITVRRVGEGRVAYVGTYLTGEVLDLVMPMCVDWSGVRPLRPRELTGVEVVEREGSDYILAFYMNSLDEPVEVPDVKPGKDALTGSAFEGGALALEPFGVRVLKRPVAGTR